MFDGASNVQLSERLLKVHNTKLIDMSGVEHTVSLFFNEVSKIPIANQIISSCKGIYNIFGSGLFHKLHPILNIYLKSFTKKHWYF